MKDTPLRILIVSHGKSGSTGLYFKIKNSFQGIHGIFEPWNYEAIRPLLNNGEPLLSKVLLPDGSPFLDQLIDAFPKRILLIRDLRDVLISSLLYNGAYDILWSKSVQEIEASLTLLEKKQDNPKSISLIDLFDGLWGEASLSEVFRRTRGISRIFSDLINDHRADFFVYRYEDFIRDRMIDLEDYLEFPLDGTAAVSEDLQRVVRTRSSGSWRNWFLPEDVAVFKPLFKDYMMAFGYDWQDWELPSYPAIERRHSTDYVRKVIEERRREKGLPSLSKNGKRDSFVEED